MNSMLLIELFLGYCVTCSIFAFQDQMFQAKADVDPLIAEQKTISSRRQRFEERTKRFMDARSRTMGIDSDALSQQVSSS